MKSLSQIAEIIKSKNDIYILTHKNPDGDAIGSACALCAILSKMGKKCGVTHSYPVSWMYQFLNKYKIEEKFNPEYIISVDLANLNLLSNENLEYANKINMCIDHHVSNTNYADVNFVDVSAAATAEIIYLLAFNLGVDIDPEIGACIYTGIVTDTGSFKYSNVTARTHKIAADLIEKGTDISSINNILFNAKLKSIIKLEGMVYNDLEYFYGGRCAVICITLDMLKRSGADESELENISSIPGGIEGVSIGITIKEKDNGVCKVSVRTKEGISARKICSKYSGGGHEYAGGCVIEGSVFDVKEKIIGLVGKEFGW